MALRLTCNRLMRTAASKSTAQRFQAMALRSFGAESPAMEPGAPAPSIMDKIISLTIVDPSGARRKINGVVGKLSSETFVHEWKFQQLYSKPFQHLTKQFSCSASYQCAYLWFLHYIVIIKFKL